MSLSGNPHDSAVIISRRVQQLAAPGLTTPRHMHGIGIALPGETCKRLNQVPTTAGDMFSSALPDCSCYAATATCRRGTLDVLIHHTSSHRLEPLKLLPIVRSVARGMLHLHSCKPAILHRDLKPANLFIGGCSPAAGTQQLQGILFLQPLLHLRATRRGPARGGAISACMPAAQSSLVS